MNKLKEYVEKVLDNCSDNPKVVTVCLVVLGAIMIVALV